MPASRLRVLETITLTHPTTVTWAGDVDTTCPAGTPDRNTVALTVGPSTVVPETVSLRALLDQLAAAEPMYAETLAARLYEHVREAIPQAEVSVFVKQDNSHRLQLTATVDQ